MHPETIENHMLDLLAPKAFAATLLLVVPMCYFILQSAWPSSISGNFSFPLSSAFLESLRLPIQMHRGAQ